MLYLRRNGKLLAGSRITEQRGGRDNYPGADRSQAAEGGVTANGDAQTGASPNPDAAPVQAMPIPDDTERLIKQMGALLVQKLDKRDVQSLLSALSDQAGSEGGVG